MLIFRQREASVSFDEFYSFIRKLYITEDPVTNNINKGLMLIIIQTSDTIRPDGFIRYVIH